MSSPINIDSRGYGKIYKAIMRNRDLPLLARWDEIRNVTSYVAASLKNLLRI